MKIGVFDSGVGGKLVAGKIERQIPNIKVIYQSDPDYFPYGNKTEKDILNRLVYFMKVLTDNDCEIIVIACNSATTNTIGRLRKKFPEIVLVGIEPPIKPIVMMTKTGKVAVIGTPATIDSNRLTELIKKYSNEVKVRCIACWGLGDLIEKDQNPRKETEILLKKYLGQPVEDGVDVVGIACTHYPYLLSQMKKLYPQVIFYDPADAVVNQVRRLVS